MTYPAGTKVSGAVTFTADGRGNLSVGCKRFTEAEVREHIDGVRVEEPSPPTWQEGDICIVTAAGVGQIGGANVGDPRVRDGSTIGRWTRADGGQSRSSDFSMNRAVAEGWYRVIRRGGVIQS